MSDVFKIVRTVLDDQYLALLMLGLMWLNVSPMTITRRWSKIFPFLFKVHGLVLQVVLIFLCLFAWSWGMLEIFLTLFSSSCRRTTKISRCLNLGSYNYLGFAASDEYCTPRAIESLKRYSPSTCSSRVDGGGFWLSQRCFCCLTKSYLSLNSWFLHQAQWHYTINWRSVLRILLENQLP